MRQVVLAAAGKLGIEEGPLPEPARGELLVRRPRAATTRHAIYVREDVEQAIELISGGQIPVGRLVTRSFPLEQAELAFCAAAEGIDGQPAVKIQLQPQS